MAANSGCDDPSRPPGGDPRPRKRKSGESPDIEPSLSLEDIEKAELEQALKLSWEEHLRTHPRLNEGPESRQVRVGKFLW